MKESAVEKAIELVNRFMFAGIYFTDGINGAKKNAKQCALIAVNEILEVLNQLTLEYEYWQEVKTEIEKL
jgi:hypothetical protein